MSNRMIAACDGACKGNPGPAAWAWVLLAADGSGGRWEAGPLGNATNNVAELTALERLLATADPAAQLEVRMDSQYAMNAVTTWLPGWKKRGWKTASGTPVANRELIVGIDALLSDRVTFVHVPAHREDGDRLNALADEAASAAAISQRGAVGTLTAEKAQSMLDATGPGPRATGDGAGSGAGTRGGAAKGSGGTLAAKFPGTCRCGRRYEAGTMIAKNPKGWGHPECARA
jgi:ribonuclease HI